MVLIRKGKCATRGFRRPLPGPPIRAAETRAAFFCGAVCAASLGHGLSYEHNFSRLLCYPICLDFFAVRPSVSVLLGASFGPPTSLLPN